jgi:hypothetical protein
MFTKEIRACEFAADASSENSGASCVQATITSDRRARLERARFLAAELAVHVERLPQLQRLREALRIERNRAVAGTDLSVLLASDIVGFLRGCFGLRRVFVFSAFAACSASSARRSSSATASGPFTATSRTRLIAFSISSGIGSLCV